MNAQRAILAVGLRNREQVTALAPRLLCEDGTIIVGGALRPGEDKVAQRVTYLAGLVRNAGLYDCEVCADGTIIPSSAPMDADDLPDFARSVLTQREWQAPQARVPARARR